MTIQTIDISDDVSRDEQFPKAVMSTVFNALRSQGYDMPPVEKYQVPDHTEELVSETAITPSFMHDDTMVSRLVTEADFPFSLEEDLDGYFGESTGSSNVTTLFQEFDMTLEETITDLSETGQIDEAISQVKFHADENVNPVEVIGYAIATYAKGWLVEKSLCQHDRFSKGSVSQDKGGLDVYDNKHDTWRQVKSVTCDKNVEGWLYYQFDMRGNLHFGDKLTDVNASAVKGSEKGQEIGKTLTRRSCPHRYTFRGRGYRYLWW